MKILNAYFVFRFSKTYGKCYEYNNYAYHIGSLDSRAVLYLRNMHINDNNNFAAVCAKSLL